VTENERQVLLKEYNDAIHQGYETADRKRVMLRKEFVLALVAGEHQTERKTLRRRGIRKRS